jgi:hypothetical protein
VIRLGKAGVFMPGTTAFVTEEDARAAAALGGFKVEGLDGAAAKPQQPKKDDLSTSQATKPAAAPTAAPAAAASSPPAGDKPKDTPTGEVKLKDEEKKDGKDAKDKKDAEKK